MELVARLLWRLLCNLLIRILITRGTVYLVVVDKGSTSLLVGITMNRSMVPGVSGVDIVSLPNVAISSYIEIVTLSDHLQNVIIKVFRFHFFTTF